MRNRYTREKKHRTGEIPTGSFSDIAFLLIIYFLVATTLVKVSGITTDLPSGEKTTQTQTDKSPTINLRSGEIFFNDKKVDSVTLNDRLAALDLANKEGKKKVIMLEADSGTTYNSYYQALATISANGGVVAPVESEE